LLGSRRPAIKRDTRKMETNKKAEKEVIKPDLLPVLISISEKEWESKCHLLEIDYHTGTGGGDSGEN